jgi:hypothetical protein
MARRPEDDAVVEVEAKDETEVEAKEVDMSDRLEGTRCSGWSESVGLVGEPSSTEGRRLSTVDERSRSRAVGGTSWTWRLRGWLVLEGGGRTMMKVLCLH